MALEGRLRVVPAPGPDGAPASHLTALRARLRVLYAHASLACPDAIVRAADHLEALHGALVGVMEQLGGPRTGEKWRKALSAVDRVPTVLDLAYLSTLPQAEPRAAVRAYAQRLLRDVGERQQAAGTIAGRSADAASAATALLGLVARAQEDGQIDEDERAALRSAAIPLQRAVAAVEALLSRNDR